MVYHKGHPTSNAISSITTRRERWFEFKFDFDDINVDTRFLSELRKITDYYDTRTYEDIEEGKILIEKINVVNVLNWQPYFHAMALQCDIQLQISAVKDF